MTVVKIEKVEVDYTEVAGQPVAWDEPKKRFYINMTKPPFDDIRVRQAANYAVDKEGLANDILAGSAVPAMLLALRALLARGAWKS